MLSRDVFGNPPAQYRPIPFWFWNSRIQEQEVEAQIRDFHEKGLGGFFIHARFGLETEYLGAEWMSCVKRAIQVASELGMEVWLYDENGFPSGVGNLEVSRVPEYRSRYIELTEAEVDGGAELDLKLPAGEVVMARATSRSRTGSKMIDLAGHVSGNRLSWRAPEGEWSVTAYSKCVLSDPNDVVFGVDYMNPDAMRAFFDYALMPYEEAIGEHFGKTVKGIFTDEPTLLPWHHDIDWYGRRSHTRLVAWDERIEPEMIERHGWTAAEFLPHLFYEIDDRTPGIRRAFWQVVADLYVKAFFQPYSKWCEEHNLKLTGHVLFEEGLYINTDFQADNAALLPHLHIPGADHLGDATEYGYGGFCNTPRHLTNLQGEKLVASISHCYGKEATISETYGCAGWGLSPARMKWIADWQYTLGINMLCPHAVFYSIEGFRKSDAPPSENHMAAWKHYRLFADYIGRLSYLLRQGRHVAKVALLYPIREFWGAHAAGREDSKDRAISDSFDLCASVLEQLHFDYDIIPEQALRTAGVEDGKIRIRDEEYDVLIASHYALEGMAGDVLRAFEEQGGKWIAPPLGDREAVSAALGSELKRLITPDVEISSPDLRYIHRKCADQHVYFFANTSDKPVRAELSLETTGEAELWDQETGAVGPASDVRIAGGRLAIGHDFAAYGSAVYVIKPGRGTREARAVVSRHEMMTLPDEWRFSTEEPNALVLSNWQINYRVHGAGCDYTYVSSFNCEFVPERLLLMLDDVEYRASLMGGMDLTICVNDEVWNRPAFGWYLDKGFKTLDISEAVQPGENRIEIVIKHSAWSGQPLLLNSPPALLGDFACDTQSSTLRKPASQVASSSWTEFGYPFFSGTGVYTQSFEIGQLPKGRVLVGVEAVRDCVEIMVNGVSAGVRLWQPWEADITDLIKPGSNELSIKVTNSMANFIEAKTQPSGLAGTARLLLENSVL
jgi:hypothetical protein